MCFDGNAAAGISEYRTPSPGQCPKVLAVTCELAPVGDNPGLFWIGWACPLRDDDFRQLRRFMVCWRAADLKRNGLSGLDED